MAACVLAPRSVSARASLFVLVCPCGIHRGKPCFAQCIISCSLVSRDIAINALFCRYGMQTGTMCTCRGTVCGCCEALVVGRCTRMCPAKEHSIRPETL